MFKVSRYCLYGLTLRGLESSFPRLKHKKKLLMLLIFTADAGDFTYLVTYLIFAMHE